MGVDAVYKTGWLQMICQKFDSHSAKANVILADKYRDDKQLPVHFAKMIESFVQLIHKAETLLQVSSDFQKTISIPEMLTDSIKADDEELRKHFAVKLVQNHVYKNQISELKKEVFLQASEKRALNLTIRYLENERAGRVQQLQVISKALAVKENKKCDVKIGDFIRDLSPELSHVWQQLESETILNKCKAFVGRCLVEINKQNEHETPSSLALSSETISKRLIGQNVRRVVVARLYSSNHGNKELGIALVGGQMHSLPVLIAHVSENSPLFRVVFSGDIVLSANGCDLSNSTLSEAADAILKRRPGELIVQNIGEDLTMSMGKSNHQLLESTISSEVDFLKQTTETIAEVSDKNPFDDSDDEIDSSIFYPIELPMVPRSLKIPKMFSNIKTEVSSLLSCTSLHHDGDPLDLTNPFHEVYRADETADRDIQTNSAETLETSVEMKSSSIQPNTKSGKDSDVNSAFAADL